MKADLSDGPSSVNKNVINDVALQNSVLLSKYDFCCRLIYPLWNGVWE